MVNLKAISAAIADLNSQKTPNFYATAKKHNIDRNTLRRRFLGESQPAGISKLEAQGKLTMIMEEILIERINVLLGRGMPPTPQFVCNLVVELSGEPVGKNWITRFVKRHDDVFCSVFFNSINYARRVADNSRHFKHYFKLVYFFSYLN